MWSSRSARYLAFALALACCLTAGCQHDFPDHDAWLSTDGGAPGDGGTMQTCGSGGQATVHGEVELTTTCYLCNGTLVIQATKDQGNGWPARADGVRAHRCPVIYQLNQPHDYSISLPAGTWWVGAWIHSNTAGCDDGCKLEISPGKPYSDQKQVTLIAGDNKRLDLDMGHKHTK